MGKLIIPSLLILVLQIQERPPHDPPAAAAEDRRCVLAVPSGVALGTGELREPLGLSADVSGSVFVADAMTGKVYRYSGDGRSIEFERPPLEPSIYPIDVASSGPFVYVLDYARNRVIRYDGRGAYLDILISFSGYDRTRPVSLTAAGGGRLITTDLENHALTVWNPLLDIELQWKEYGWIDGSLDRPAKAGMLPDERIAVAELGNRRVQIFSPSGAWEKTLELPEGREFLSPRSLCSDREGNLFVADTEAGCVYQFCSDGSFGSTIESFLGKPLSPSAVAAGWNDDLYVADIRSRSVLVFRLEYPGR